MAKKHDSSPSHDGSTSSPHDTLPYFYRSSTSPRNPVRLTFAGQGKTHQSFRDECDINRIMGRYAITGVLDFLNKKEAVYADVSEADFQRSMDIVVQANAMFDQLPSNIRERFSNDPARLLAFLDDPVNRDEATRLGLVNAVQAAQEAPQAPPVAPAPPTPQQGG